MKLVESLLFKNPCYTEGRTIEVRGLMLHSVGGPVQSAEKYIVTWNDESFDRACVHAFIDGYDGTIYQTLPWNHRGWHAGGQANNTHIGIEMCEYSGLNYDGSAVFTCDNPEEAAVVAKRTYEAAVELFAILAIEFHLDPLEKGVIISHSEGHALGVASGHKDPEHLWTQLNLDYTMDRFREDVKNMMTLMLQ